jgi:hypothetical protein
MNLYRETDRQSGQAVCEDVSPESIKENLVSRSSGMTRSAAP